VPGITGAASFIPSKTNASKLPTHGKSTRAFE